MKSETGNDAAAHDAELRDKINRGTARLPWAELQRHFAQGTVVHVDAQLDLVEVALRIARDDKASIAHWLAEALLAKVSDAQARAWTEGDAVLWTSVVNPFVLVQTEKAARRPEHPGATV